MGHHRDSRNRWISCLVSGFGGGSGRRSRTFIAGFKDRGLAVSRSLSVSSGGRTRTCTLRFNRAPPYHSAPHRYLSRTRISPNAPRPGISLRDARPPGVPLRSNRRHPSGRAFPGLPNPNTVWGCCEVPGCCNNRVMGFSVTVPHNKTRDAGVGSHAGRLFSTTPQPIRPPWR